MNAFRVATLGLLLAATAAEAQKAPTGEATTGVKPAPGAEATVTPEAGATADTGAEAAAPAAPAAPVADGLIVASDPQGIVSAMQALGYTATLGTDGAGDPTVTGAIDGTNYNVYFYGCQNNTNCQWLIFSAGFDLPNGSTLQVINDWNTNNLVGQAYLDAAQDPFLNYFVTTTGGLTQANFADVVDWWKVALGNFETAIGY
jgi:Putative bacterial sensory transduction regulator